MPFKLFQEQRLSSWLEQMRAAIKAEIDQEKPEYLTAIDETQYIDHVVSKYHIDPLVIDVDNVEATSEERYLSYDDGYRQNFGKTRVQVVTFLVPFSGDPFLLRCRPDRSLMWEMSVEVQSGSFAFEVVDHTGDMNSPRMALDRAKANINQILQSTNEQLGTFNSDLRNTVTTIFQSRKADLLKKSQALTTLGVPIRKSSSIPTTFSVPTVRKKIAVKPSAPATSAVPNPVLAAGIYADILKTIFDMGRNLERYPSTYKDKDENALRDHFIMVLEPHFEGSTTGETFNRSGKTDILIRYEKENIFVAECKFWGGKAKHHATIDQLLTYLTFRDSKTAIIYFVNQKDISHVFAEIEKETRTHLQFVSAMEKKDPSWQVFEFCLPGDPGCKIILTVLAFHLP